MSANWVVLKFGGTSVTGRPQWEAISALLRARLEKGHHVLLVCSAVAGVTNELAAMAAAGGPTSGLNALLERHGRLAAELGIDESLWKPDAVAQLERCMQGLSEAPGHSAQADLLAMGEWLSTRIGAEFLKKIAPVQWLDVRSALYIVEEPGLSAARQWLSASCAAKVDDDLQLRWAELGPAIITQGYSASAPGGKTALLGRGGSDTSAALLAGRLAASELEIWTDVPGLFSADPRLVPEARLLTELDYDEALEMAASGAKVIHPRAIRAAAATATPISIKDSARPGMVGTRISRQTPTRTGEVSPGVKAITCQKDMMVLLLQNIDPRREVGFLARVFGVFERHGVSIDLVATSETTTTVALNRSGNHLEHAASEALIGELEIQCRVTVYADCVCLNLVGSSVRTVLANAGSTFRFFDDHPLLMLSQSANDRCLSLLIESQDHEKLLRQAHQALIPVDGGEVNSAFGPSWAELQNRS